MADVPLNNLLFIDIETISQTEDFAALPERLQAHWQIKSNNIKAEGELKDTYFDRAAIYAEFGRVLCIAVGGFYDNNKKLRVKTLYNDSEKLLLEEFKKVLEKHPAGKNLVLCAHNGKEFDFPYLCRRMLINEIPLPEVLQISGKKPWEINHLDTLEMWRFGDYKNYTSLDLLASVFDIPGSKTIMHGSEVNKEYYLNKGIEKIVRYCSEDVVVLAQLYLRLIGKNLLSEANINRT